MSSEVEEYTKAVIAEPERGAEAVKAMEKQEMLKFLGFIDGVFGDSPHAGDDQTWEWFNTMMEKLKTIVGEKK